MKNTLLLRERSTQAHEVSLCYTRPLFNEMVSIHSSEDIEKVMRRYLGNQSLDVKEYMWLFCLNRAHRLLSLTELSIGNIFGTVVSISEIFQIALQVHGAAIVLVHNHPSGKMIPSSSDIAITKKVVQFGKMIEINLLDHVIITSESYYSLADNGLL